MAGDSAKPSFLRRSAVAPGVNAPCVRRDSQREMKTGPTRMVVRSPEPATVGLNDRSADTKPHTGAVFLGRKESVEYLARLVRGKSNSSVLDRYQKLFVAIILGAERQLTRAIDGLHGVDAVDHQVH